MNEKIQPGDTVRVDGVVTLTVDNPEAFIASVPNAEERVEIIEKAEPRPVGRPSDYTQEIADKICAKLSQGMSLRAVCREEDMPSAVTVFAWFRTYPDFLNQYARAKEESADADEETLEDIGDQSIEAAWQADPKAAGAIVSAYKLKADNIKWAMSKKKPKKYGDKLDLTSGGEKLPTPIYGGVSTKTDGTDSQV